MVKTSKWLKAIFVLSLLLTTRPLGANNTLVSAVDVRECVYDYWAARLRDGVVQAHQATELARSAFLPSLVASASSGKDLNVSDPAGVNSVGTVSITQQIMNIAQKLNVSSKLHDERASVYQLEDGLLSLMRTSLTSFYQYQILKMREDLLLKRASRLDKAVTLARELSRLSVTDRSSVFMAQAEKAQLDVALMSLRADEAVALNNLKAVLGLPPAAKFDINGAVKDDPNLAVAFWERKIDDLPAVREIKEKIESQKLLGKSARSEILPSLSVNAAYGSSILYTSPGMVVMGTVSVPLFDQGSRAVRAEAAESVASVYEARLSSQRIQLMADVKNLLDQIDLGQKNYDLSKQQLDIAQKAYDAVWSLFSLGKSNFLTVKDSEIALLDAETQVGTVDLQLQQIKALLELMQTYTDGRFRAQGRPAGCHLSR